MDTTNHFTLAEAAPKVGVCYMTIYRWVRDHKLKTVEVFGRRVIPLDELRPLVVHKCSNCYYEKHEDGTRTCACREISDIDDGCKDWVWRYDRESPV